MKTTNSYNIIGDIHGRTCWKNLVREDGVNIFVGDYFDPYGYVPQVERMANFQDIMEFKRQHPETVLLYGNHDGSSLIAKVAASVRRNDQKPKFKKNDVKFAHVIFFSYLCIAKTNVWRF